MNTIEMRTIDIVALYWNTVKMIKDQMKGIENLSLNKMDITDERLRRSLLDRRTNNYDISEYGKLMEKMEKISMESPSYRVYKEKLEETEKILHKYVAKFYKENDMIRPPKFETKDEICHHVLAEMRKKEKRQKSWKSNTGKNIQ